MAKATPAIHLMPLSGGDPEPESAGAEFVVQRVANYVADKKRQQDDALRYGTVEANSGSSHAGIMDPNKFPKRKKKD